MNLATWPSKPRDLARHGVLVGPDDLAHLLGSSRRRQRGRADQVDEHHGQLAALGVAPTAVSWPGRGTSVRGVGEVFRHEGGDRPQQFLARAERQPELLEVGLAQIGQDVAGHLGVAERRLVPLQPQLRSQAAMSTRRSLPVEPREQHSSPVAAERTPRWGALPKPRDDRPFFVAGLWSDAPDPSTGEITDSYTMVIGDANAAMRVHDRML